MAKGKEYIISGFIGMNTGKIKNCSATMHMNAKQGVSGFCGMNSGEIQNSFSENRYKGKEKIIGFSRNTKGITDCYCVLDEKTKPEAILDKNYVASKEEVLKKRTKEQKTDQEKTKENENKITIRTPQEFLQFAANVNEGLEEYSCATVVLEKDIDLKGKKIVPIGKGEFTPFRGRFLGNGFRIQNCVIRERKSETAGLFGYIKEGTIENLHVDCVVHGGKYAGAIAGVNDGGKILGCHAAVRGDAQYCFGGLIGKNSGRIENCSCTGRADKPGTAAPLIGTGSAAAFMVAAGVGLYLAGNKGNGSVRYPALPVSEDAVPIEGDHDKPEKNGNSVQYKMETELYTKTGEGQVAVKFENPGKSNHNVVLELQLTQDEMKRKKIKYKGTASRAVIAKSGAITPGYKLDKLQLKTMEDGTVLKKGTYHAVAYLSLYDINTNAKAMVNAQTPVTLVIGG